jgi:Putative integral membrane protein DUF46.
MSPISKLVFLILPVILAGVSNMIFMKRPILQSWRIPMDGGKVLADGERLFGDNKTWKGFVGMIIFMAFWMWMFEIWAKHSPAISELSLIPYTTFHFPFNGLFYGAIWGLGYVLAELPNSYLKRRMKIQPGKSAEGKYKLFFTILDQSDSVIGCLIFMRVFYAPSLIDSFMILIIASGFHYLTNVGLYFVGLKRQRG